MADTNERGYVVVINRDAKQDAQKIASELGGVPGVEVTAKSPSYVDIITNGDVLTEEKLKSIVSGLGAELHITPEVQLIDPIPAKKIP